MAVGMCKMMLSRTIYNAILCNKRRITVRTMAITLGAICYSVNMHKSSIRV